MGTEAMITGSKKVLLFGFDTLPEILRLRDTAASFGAELIPVGKSDCGRTLATLAGLEEDGGSPEPGAVPGRMAVLCGLDSDLETLLPALNRAGAGESCMKAVLTRHNRSWSAVRLYNELAREHAAIHQAAKAVQTESGTEKKMEGTAAEITAAEAGL